MISYRVWFTSILKRNCNEGWQELQPADPETSITTLMHISFWFEFPWFPKGWKLRHKTKVGRHYLRGFTQSINKFFMMWEFLISNQKKPEGMSSILLHLPNKKEQFTSRRRCNQTNINNCIYNPDTEVAQLYK